MSSSLQSSGCIGCNVKPKVNSSLHDEFRGQENHALTKSQASNVNSSLHDEFRGQENHALTKSQASKVNSSLHDEFRGQENHALTKSQASLSEDFGTSSACEVDNAPKQSCGSISSTSALPQMHDDVQGAECSSKPSEFVNHGGKVTKQNKDFVAVNSSLDQAYYPEGLIFWNENRQKWKGNKEPETGPKQQQEPKLSWNTTYDNLLSGNKPFQQPIPLAEMVDFLVAIWEQEGVYD